ncbi:MAG: glutathione binding-like protein [Steroidobacteraceae bacterium]
MIDLHTTATANGYKAALVLEEMALPYRVIAYDLTKGEHLAPAYLQLNPVGRLPTIVDHDGSSSQPIVVYGTAAIASYLADKTGLYMPKDVAGRAACQQWIGIVSSDLGPAYTGQFVFNVLAPQADAWAIQFYDRLVTRLLVVVEARLAANDYLAGGEYSIADMLAYPVAAVSAKRFPGNLADYPAIAGWAGRIAARPAVQRAMRVPA